MSDFQNLLDQAPEACTLPTFARPLRIVEFADLFASAKSKFVRNSATRATLALPLDALDQARALAARETACCSFFSFRVEQAGDHTHMTIEVPAHYADVLTAMTKLPEQVEQ